MRWIRNAIVFLIFIVFTISTYSYVSPLFTDSISSDRTDLDSIQFKDASIKIAYNLKDIKWLSYSLQPTDELIRVMSNAVINLNYQINEDQRFLYSIIYEVLNEDDDVIRSDRFYHRAAQKVYLEEKSGQHYVSTSVYPRDENVVDSRIHLINLRGLNNASMIRFRSGEFTYPVEKLVLRAYEKKNISDRKLQYAWQRMGNERRQQLAKVSVYDDGIINEQEQHQLLKNQWAPLGPLGVDDEDYFIEKLYVAREIENDVVINVPAVPSSGLVIYPDRYGIITLPEDFRQLKISWDLFDTATISSATDKIRVEWWGHPATRYKKWNSLLSAGELILKASSGILRISADQPIVIRAWQTPLREHSDVLEITPAPAYLRLYGADSSDNSGLMYKVHHITGYKTPFRFDFRAIDLHSSLANISYRLLDKNNHSIKSGKLKIPDELSAYDGVVAEPASWLTEPLHVYFNLPRRVNKIVFNAPPGVWISAYSRPKNLAYTQMHPSANYLVKNKSAKKQNAAPVWFGVRPENWKKNMRNALSQLITVQRRVPQIDPQLLAGQYKWDQFYPDTNWKGRYILSATEKDQPFREESLGSRYLSIAASKDIKIKFSAKAGVNSLRPTLIYVQNKKREMTVRVWLDKKLFFEKKVYSKNGEFLLPYIIPGSYTLRIENEYGGGAGAEISSNADYYINNAQSPRKLKTGKLKTGKLKNTKLNNGEIKNSQVKKEPVRSGPVKNGPIKNGPIKSGPIKSGQEKQNQKYQPVSYLKRVIIKVSDKAMSFRVKKEKPQELLALRIYTRQSMDQSIKLKVKVNGMDSRLLGPFDDWTLIYRDYDLSPLTSIDASPVESVLLKTDHNVSTERLFFIPLGSDMPVQKKYNIDIKLQYPDDAYITLTRSIPGLYPSRKIYPDVEVEMLNE